MNEELVERLERTLWELDQLASELSDLGFIAQANLVSDIVNSIDEEQELDNVA
jgi:hypothetical protein